MADFDDLGCDTPDRGRCADHWPVPPADFDDLCCDGCGSQRIEHFQTSNGTWHNRCRGCQRVTEYIPSRAEIAAACQAIREARPWQAFEDDDERTLRWAEAALLDEDGHFHDGHFDEEGDDPEGEADWDSCGPFLMDRACPGLVKPEQRPAIRRAG